MSGVFFNGQFLVSPVTASVVNDDAMRNQNLTVGNAVAVVGTSGGGKPKSALTFGSPEEARATLKSGPLLDNVIAAFGPSDETGGPSSVTAIRVNPALQAAGTIKDGSAVTLINLTSRGYGKDENNIRAAIEAGTLRGFRATLQRRLEFFTEDNLYRAAFSIRYTGAEATGALSVTGTTVVLKAPLATTVATIDLTEFDTIQELVDRINLVSGFTAAVLDNNYSKPALNGLDYVTNQDVKTATYTATATLQAVVDYFNGPKQNLVSATRASGVGSAPAVQRFLLTGGSDGSTTNSDWIEAFEALQGVDVQWVNPASGDEVIHAMASSHVAYMSNVVGKERRVICGTDLNTSDDAALDAAKALNSDRVSLVHIGNYDFDTAGKLQLFPAHHTAAKVAGAFAGVNPGTPLTNKTIRCRGLERDLRNPTDTDRLIQGGILCVENTDQGCKVVKSISTWLINDNFNRVEQSCGAAVDFVSRNVREALDVLRGTKGNPLALSRAVSITESTLKELARPEPQGPGVLAGDAASPAFRNISATIEGDVLRVQFECSPVIPLNYVLVTIFAVPYSGAAAAA